MSFNIYMLFYGAIVIFLVVLFIKQRRLSAPTKLKLKTPRTLEGSNFAPTHIDGSKNLTIYFNYNGETMEAHEVLGVPAGAPLTMAEEAFKSVSVSDPPRRDVYLHAIQAIRQSR